MEGTPRAQTVPEWVASVDPTQWHVRTVGEGAQGPRTYQFVAQRVWESREGVPGRPSWLIARRNRDGSDLKFYLSNAPAEAPLQTLAQVGAWR